MGDGTKDKHKHQIQYSKIEGRQLTIQNISDDKNVIVLSEEFVDETFIYSHCATCHSSQGSSIKETLTIHEWDLPFVSRKWRYTALTRCVDSRNEQKITKNLIRKLNSICIKIHVGNKIEGYKRQDMKADREINEDEHIDVEWCMARLIKQ